MTTNITAAQPQGLRGLAGQRLPELAIFSCLVAGKPAAAMVSINHEGGDFQPEA